MKILPIKNLNLKKVADELKTGAVIAVATETVYGFSCDPSNQKAVEKIYKIKGMGFKKPLLLITDNLKIVRKYFKMNKTEKELALKYWPGALNIILKLKKNSSAGMPEKCGLVIKDKQELKFKRLANESAVRISSDKLMQGLARECGGFVASTSANLSGKKECLSGMAVYRQFRNRRYQPDLILDSGKLKTKKPSTIVKVEGKEIKVLRQGEIRVKF